MDAGGGDRSAREVVLVVDDIQENIDMLAGVLGEEYRVKAALSGERALAIARRSPPPGLILLDVEMPGLDGYAVCEQLQADPATRAIPVIFITARDRVEDKLRGFALGAVDYVPKPFQGDEVLARVRTHMELRRARETIRRHSEELEAILAVRTRELVRSERQAAFGQLVQGIVHNLRSPLAAIVMALEELRFATEAARAAEGADEELAELRALRRVVDTVLQVAPTSGQRINHMLESLMAKSRADKKREPGVMDLNAFVRTELEFLQADRRLKHSTEKIIELSPEPVLVKAIPGDLSQVLHNLVLNALDAMHGAPLRRLTISTASSNETALLTVTDSGPGIPEAVRDRIFDPFFTTKPAEEEREPGARTPTGNGLGLWTCREVVAGCGGEVGFETREGGGTTFWVRLPLAVRGALEDLVP